MSKKVKIIIAGAMVYWIVSIFYAKLFWNFMLEHGVIGALLFDVIIPFLLGLIISVLLNDKYSWIYGVITFHVYMLLHSLLNFIFFVFIYRTYSISRELYDIKQHYFYTGILATLFAIIGGLIGYYIKRLAKHRTS